MAGATYDMNEIISHYVYLSPPLPPPSPVPPLDHLLRTYVCTYLPWKCLLYSLPEHQRTAAAVAAAASLRQMHTR